VRPFFHRVRGSRSIVTGRDPLSYGSIVIPFLLVGPALDQVRRANHTNADDAPTFPSRDDAVAYRD
jgi:hypothetical protein